MALLWGVLQAAGVKPFAAPMISRHLRIVRMTLAAILGRIMQCRGITPVHPREQNGGKAG